MREITIACTRSEQAATLEALQDAGVLHIVETSSAAVDGVAACRARLGAARHAAEVLASIEPRSARPAESGGDLVASMEPVAGDRPMEDVVHEVEEATQRVADLRRTHDELVLQHQRLRPFGAFDPDAIRHLHDQGVAVRLARPPRRRPPPPVADAVWVELGGDRDRLALALVGRREAVAAADVPHEIELPTASPERIAHEIAHVRRELERTRERLEGLTVARADVERWVRRSEDALRLEEARAAMESVGSVRVLRGYAPADEVDRLSALARERGWGLWVATVSHPDDAPTLIRNPPWVRQIAPLFSFLGVVPAYGHVDISIPFLLFFGLFFAMIVGDAGYGLLFLVLTEIARRRLPPSADRAIALMRVLSVATIAWGVASGNYFGAEALPPGLVALRLDWLTEGRNVMSLTFAIGVVHLTLAHVWNVVRFLNSARALVELGWIATTWAMYFLARHLVLGEAFPAIAWMSLGVGVALIATFITPWRRLRHEWFTHAMLPLNLVTNFVDVVSYVRLFAVGAATFAVAESFNALAASVGLGGLLGGAISALVLFFGHALNVLLAAMGVLVHGVRLNTLEFAGHLSLSWTGHPYRPFARTAPRDSEGGPSWAMR